MLSIALYVLAISASAHADPRQLSKATRDDINSRIEILQLQAAENKCNDPFRARLDSFASLEELSAFASITDRIAFAEMRANPQAYAKRAMEPLYAVGRLESNMQGIADDSKEWASILSEINAVSQERIASFQDNLLRHVRGLEDGIKDVHSLIADDKIPLSFKGPLENLVEKAPMLIEAVDRTVKAGLMVNGRSKYARTIGGEITDEAFTAMYKTLDDELKNARKFYDQKRSDASALTEQRKCPSIIAKQRQLRSLLRAPSKEILAADAKVQEADAVQKQVYQQGNRLFADAQKLMESANEKNEEARRQVSERYRNLNETINGAATK